MQVIRTAIWIIIAVVLVAFIAINWTPVEVNIWPTENGYLHFDWPVGFIVLLSFLLGLLPMWLVSKAGKWRLNRRINALENTVKAVAPSPSQAPPVPSSPPDAANESPAA